MKELAHWIKQDGIYTELVSLDAGIKASSDAPLSSGQIRVRSSLPSSSKAMRLSNVAYPCVSVVNSSQRCIDGIMHIWSGRLHCGETTADSGSARTSWSEAVFVGQTCGRRRGAGGGGWRERSDSTFTGINSHQLNCDTVSHQSLGVSHLKSVVSTPFDISSRCSPVARGSLLVARRQELAASRFSLYAARRCCTLPIARSRHSPSAPPPHDTSDSRTLRDTLPLAAGRSSRPTHPCTPNTPAPRP
ncbi:hypothetical protein GGX14DRAFT_568899 [Mycena pura]|uniref:Uncharacterized protein n=1 Tax=Mycena pura TaxID=153505 RepID=A0AAD6V895_9AGAR|nr:hypothetical protein GGX14DRAFT_568899 [Mycena pura]